MVSDDIRAMNAVWKSQCLNDTEKMVLCHLAGKHELGDRHSSSWKPVNKFITDFEERWSLHGEIQEATQLSQVKIARAIQTLQDRGYVKKKQQEAPNRKPDLMKKKHGHSQVQIAITDKIFVEFQTDVQKIISQQTA